ncbi:high-affinity nicotinic acid transporter protein [Rutstroemia sp. NJR-2017a WRK4]|nr:high-affinity nicotinic acid transporter protein [Rutstroemia sp. NJR-2017a WRK4]
MCPTSLSVAGALIISRALPTLSPLRGYRMSSSSNTRGSIIGPESHVLDKLPETNPSLTVATEGFNNIATKKLIRKLDLRLIPILAVLFLLCFLDRSNIGNARLQGLEKDLHMAGLDYNIALAVFFPCYIVVGIPSNMMMNRCRPNVWLTVLVLSWSVIMVCMGFVRNLAGLALVRCFLGIAEGGLAPGITYYITMWYPRQERGLRLALFLSTATAAGAFGGLFARVISEMNGVGGKAGWPWIFIIEGLLSFCVGSSERNEVVRRLSDDRQLLSDDWDTKYIWQALTDWKIYVEMLIILGVTTPLYSLSLFLPTIVKDLGYTTNISQLMTVPPYVIACAVSIVASYYSDKLQQRAFFVLGFQLVAIIGFSLLITSDKSPIQYAGALFAAVGIFPLLPLTNAWFTNNIGGGLKRSIGVAMFVGLGNCGGVLAAFGYRPVDAPRYIQGHTMLLGLLSMSFVLALCMTAYYKIENRRRDAADRERGLTVESYTEEMKLSQEDRGDDATFWRFSL